MKKLKIMLIFLLLFYSTYSQISVTKGVSTFHLDNQWEYNNENEIVGIEINNFYFQHMINSFGESTISLTYNMYYKRFYVGLGISKGYSEYYVGEPDENHLQEVFEYIPYINNGYSYLGYIGFKINDKLMLTYSGSCVNISVKHKIKG